jgi:hypothetical protein
MATVAILERNDLSMKRGDDEDIRKILERLEKLSARPENPGMAYRNLETINALIEPLRKKLGKELKSS